MCTCNTVCSKPFSTNISNHSFARQHAQKTSSMASAATPATTADVPPATGSSRSAQAAHLSKDKCIAEHASGRPLNLQGSKTLDFGEDAPDELRDLEHDSGLHVFSAGYDVYALPKHQ